MPKLNHIEFDKYLSECEDEWYDVYDDSFQYDYYDDSCSYALGPFEDHVYVWNGYLQKMTYCPDNIHYNDGEYLMEEDGTIYSDVYAHHDRDKRCAFMGVLFRAIWKTGATDRSKLYNMLERYSDIHPDIFLKMQDDYTWRYF